MWKNYFAGFSYRKVTKIKEIVQNIKALITGAQPGFSQILYPITILAKTVSQMVVNNLQQVGNDLLNNVHTGYMGWMDKKTKVHHPFKL